MKVLLSIFAIGILALCVNADDICVSSESGYAHPKPNNCTHFYLCVKQVSEERKCAFGLHFSPIKRYCQKPEIAGCKLNGDLPDCSNSINGTTFPKPNDCDKFYLCTNNVAVVKNCKSGLHYNAKKGFCELPEVAGCEDGGNIPGTDCSNSANGVTFPKPGYCDQFYLCMNKESVSKNCHPGLHYSAKRGYCVLPDIADCEWKTTLPTDPTKPTDPPTKPPPTETPPLPSELCKGQPLGRKIQYPGVCEKYITCIGGGVVEVCKSPLHFHEKKQTCDWPEAVKCPWQ